MFDASEGDDIPNDGDVFGLGKSFPRDGYGDFGSLGPTHLHGGFMQVHVLGGMTIDLCDMVSRLDSRLKGRCILYGGDDQ